MGTFALGAFFLLSAGALAAALLALWPVIEAATQDQPRASAWSFLGLGSWTLTPDTALLFLVIVVGGLGSVVHGATSFASYVGNKRLQMSWAWWYVLRLTTGSTLAVLVYFALRAGVLTGDATSAQVNPYGVALVAGLAGLFSKQAVDKLREVFDTLLRGRPGTGDDERADKMASPLPVLDAVDPTGFPKGSVNVVLTLRGRGFTPDSRVSARRTAAGTAAAVEFDDLVPDEVTRERLRVTIPDALTADAGAVEVEVVNPPPGGGRSQTQPFSVT